MNRAVLYARVSSDDRSKDGRNLAGQIEMCREYAKRQGYEIIAELPEDDRGASGADWDLPQLTQALNMAQAGQFNVLVVREIDRFARNLAKQLVTEQQFKTAGVLIDYVIGDYPDTAEGRLNKNVKAVIAEYEREQIKARMTRGRRLKVAAGNVMMHTRAPYGYSLAKVNGKTVLEVFEPEAEIVRMIFNWYAYESRTNGKGISICEIARRLTEMGIATSGDKKKFVYKKRGRGEWAVGTVNGILTNPTYAGTWYYGKTRHVEKTKVVENPREYWLSVDVPPIVDAATWQAAQERLKINKEQAIRNRKRFYLLSGLCTCGLCGSRVYVGGVYGDYGPKFYYRCAAAWGKIVGRTCDAPNFRVDLVEGAVWAWVKSRLLDPEILRAGLAKYQDETMNGVEALRERVTMVDKLLADNRRQLEKLIDLYLSSDELTKDLLTDRKRRIEEVINSLTVERESLAQAIDKQVLTDNQIENVLEFGARITERFDAIDSDLTARRSILDLLRTQVVFTIEEGKQVLRVYCIMGQDDFIVPVTSQSNSDCSS